MRKSKSLFLVSSGSLPVDTIKELSDKIDNLAWYRLRHKDDIIFALNTRLDGIDNRLRNDRV